VFGFGGGDIYTTLVRDRASAPKLVIATSERVIRDRWLDGPVAPKSERCLLE
jgi:hypothetical protein